MKRIQSWFGAIFLAVVVVQGVSHPRALAQKRSECQRIYQGREARAHAEKFWKQFESQTDPIRVQVGPVRFAEVRFAIDAEVGSVDVTEFLARQKGGSQANSTGLALPKKSSSLVQEVKEAMSQHRLHEDYGVVTDFDNIEIQTRGSMSSPRQFVESTRDLIREFPGAAVHLHVGLPEAVLTDEDARYIAQALEARVVFDLIEDFDFDAPESEWSKLFMINAGPLRGVDGRKSVVKFEPKRWVDDTGRTWHDLELRQHWGLQDGLKKVAWVAELVKRSRELHLPKVTNYSDRRHLLTHQLADVYGAVMWLRAMLEMRPQEVKRLEALDKVLENYESISPKADSHELAHQLQDWLIDHDIVDLLSDPNFYFSR